MKRVSSESHSSSPFIILSAGTVPVNPNGQSSLALNTRPRRFHLSPRGRPSRPPVILMPTQSNMRPRNKPRRTSIYQTHSSMFFPSTRRARCAGTKHSWNLDRSATRQKTWDQISFTAKTAVTEKDRVLAQAADAASAIMITMVISVDPRKTHVRHSGITACLQASTHARQRHA